MIKVGEHVTLDIIGTKKEYEPSFFEVLVNKIAEKAKVTVLNISKYKFEPQGFTLVALLAESHMSFHTYPKKGRKKKTKENDHLRNVSIPKGIEVDSVNLEQAKFLCSLPKVLGQHPESNKDITLNSGRFGPYLKCENKSARLENVEEIFTIGINRAVTMIAEAKPGRMSSSIIKDLGEHPDDKKPVRIMKGQYGPYIKYKSF